ncbi:caspase family protein [uncultured Thiodictyon sp.]|uniref:caspase family protein n=1 Tax=uncultured Thiodictyon sp. TaxID=1846217 RepID=UPI0025DAD285|nr:caspase family protein [uncultured Thiodictyon sp.]
MAFTQGHALLIGVGSYQHEPQLNVPITAADAQRLAGVLRDPVFCSYPADQVTVLHDATASRAGILAALDALGERAGAADTVFLYFCGHGAYGEDGDYYLTAHDTGLNSGRVVSGSGLRQGELIGRLRAIKAKRLLLVVNACHAGELAPTLRPAAAPGIPLPAQTAAALLASGEGRIIITACREGQVSYIGRGALTLFTQALVDGLQGRGTISRRGFVSAFDLYTHLYFKIEETVRRDYGAAQEPELTVLKGVGPFAVALCQGATVLGDFDGTAQPPDGLAVRQVNPAYARAMIAQHSEGPGTTTIGPAAVLVRGNNTGTINTGIQIDTGGGAYVDGNVTTGGDFVGRDKITKNGG